MLPKSAETCWCLAIVVTLVCGAHSWAPPPIRSCATHPARYWWYDEAAHYSPHVSVRCCWRRDLAKSLIKEMRCSDETCTGVECGAGGRASSRGHRTARDICCLWARGYSRSLVRRIGNAAA